MIHIDIHHSCEGQNSGKDGAPTNLNSNNANDAQDKGLQNNAESKNSQSTSANPQKGNKMNSWKEVKDGYGDERKDLSSSLCL